MKKSLLFLFIILAVLMTACNKKQLRKKPEDLIPADKMTMLVSDILLIENTLNMMPPDSNKWRMINIYYQNLFTNYQVTKEQFQKSIDYYLSNEDDAVKIFHSVEEELKGIEKETLREDENDNEERVEIVS